MINRRRRASSVSVASRQEEDIADDSTPEQSPVLSVGRKRKRPDPVIYFLSLAVSMTEYFSFSPNYASNYTTRSGI